MATHEMTLFPKFFAHRGASAYAPENTLAAFQKAKNLNASWVELDIQLSMDLELIVFHDDVLDRITQATGPLYYKTAAELCALDAGSWFSTNYRDEKICTLKDALSFFYKNNLHVNIEIKPISKEMSKQRAPLLRNLQSLLLSTPSSVEIIISTFDLDTLEALANSAISSPRALLIDEWDESLIEKAIELSCYSVHLNYQLLNAERMDYLKKTPLKIAAYTVNTKKLADSLFELGVDGVFTDYYDKLTKI